MPPFCWLRAPCTSAFGAQTYYVNDGENTLALADAYAIGADGSTAKLPERGVYAATASGTQLLGGSEYENEQPNIPNGIVRVGLAFGSTALDAVHLQIKTGSGFAFGYYDSDRVFRSVGSTAESAVTVVADTNVTAGDSTFGAYHVQLGTAYASFDAAEAAARDRGGYPVFYNGTYYVRVGSYTTMEAASNSAATAYGSVVSGGARSVLVVKAGTGRSCSASTAARHIRSRWHRRAAAALPLHKWPSARIAAAPARAHITATFSSPASARRTRKSSRW